MIIKNIHLEIVAKTNNTNKGVSVFAHSMIVGIVCQEILKYIPKKFVEKYKLQRFPGICSLHDIGKASPGFQEMIDFNLGLSKFDSLNDIKNHYVTEHEITSHEYLRNFHEKTFCKAECLLATIRWHHGKCRNSDQWSDYDGHEKFGDGVWDDIRNDIYNSLKNYFGDFSELVSHWSILNKGKITEAVIDVDVKFLMGLLCVCDWIGSDETVFNPNDYMGDFIDVDLIIKNANDGLLKYGFEKCDYFVDLSFPKIFDGYIPNNIQKSLYDIVDSPGIYVVEAPMGFGKTEAAEFASYKCLSKGICNGVYFALPTQTTSNSIFNRYKNFVKRISNIDDNDIRLAHNKSIFSEVNSGMQSWYTGKRSILSQFALGTLDQALMGVIGQVKHFFVRCFGLANKVVIIDEIHTYDTYTKTLILELIDQLLQLDCVIIILSATLTQKARQQLCGDDCKIDKYPLITKVVGENVSHHTFKTNVQNKNIKLKFSFIKNDIENFILTRTEHLNDVKDRILSGQKILWIENTVKESQLVYNYLKGFGIDCGLLNSRFTNKDRTENETFWIKRFGKGSSRDVGCVLVSTQICEQSVDIDADYLVTSIAPIDMIFQRLGRLHRHDIPTRTHNPECLILSTDAFDVCKDWKSLQDAIGSTAYVYDKHILRNTHKILTSLKEINIPQDIRKYLELVYDDNDDEFGTKLKTYRIKKEKQKELQARTTLDYVCGNLEDECESNIDDLHSTRLIDNKTEDIILVSEILNEKYNKFKSLYGNVFTIGFNLSLDIKKIIDDSSIKLSETFIKKHPEYFMTIQLGHRSYKICQIENELVVDRNKQSVTNCHYSKTSGFEF